MRNPTRYRATRRVSSGWALALALLSGALAPRAGWGAETGPAVPAATSSGVESHYRESEAIARSVALATGVPISPLLGVSTLGAWNWWRTPEGARAALPWYDQPWFWGTGLALVVLFVANTTIGAAVPGLKKPMDFVEHHENQLSALLASPIVAAQIVQLLARGAPGAAGANGVAAAAVTGTWGVPGLAALASLGDLAHPLLAVAGGVLYALVFGVVFLAFHAVQVLIVLSPSATLDLFLRAVRTAMFGGMALSTLASPYVGAALGLFLLFGSLLIAGWSFRLTVYGTVVSWDFLAARLGAGDPARERLAAFSQGGLRRVPRRTYGRLDRRETGWVFRYRPWLVLPARETALPAETLAIVRGALSPLAVPAKGGAAFVRFPPRFRGREAELARRLGAVDVRPGPILRGLRAAWRWLREFFAAAESEPAAVPTPPAPR
ncbi:MAG: hypothetical protein U0X73_01485 [Thermoanaerobaculia bacterium]